MGRKRLPDAAERRRLQNAQAQRTYRARQKERARALERMVVAAVMNNASADYGTWVGPAPSTTSEEFEVASSSFDGTLIRTPTGGDPAKDVYHILRPHFKDDTSNYLRVVIREHFAIRDIVKYGLISLGYAMSPELFQCAASLSFRRWAELVEANYTGLDIKYAVAAGVKLLAELNPPTEWMPEEWLQPPCPKVTTKTITIKAMSFIAAMLTNAVQLRLPVEALMDEGAESRFYSAGAQTSELEEDLNQSKLRLAFDLVPTAIQRSIPHHPCYDLVPWATFRSRIIQAVSIDPPIVDADDLCLDMFGGGLRCWGSVYGSMHGHGQGAPWDSRSWEAMPWFLDKWAIFTGGEDEEVCRNSAWWRAMRGDDGDEPARWPYG